MSAIFIIVSVLTCFSMWIVIRTLCKQSRDEGFADGYRAGTYDALKTDLAVSKTQFPHR